MIMWNKKLKQTMLIQVLKYAVIFQYVGGPWKLIEQIG